MDPILQEILYQKDYGYEPVEEGQIRVLVLDAGVDKDPLQGRLEICQLCDAQYSAISYAWGRRRMSHVIKLDSTYLTIQSAADAALRRFRHPSAARRLWIDSICINQSDVVEKSAQVTRMGDVYRNASEVLVWLGESAPSSSLAFWACYQLASSWEAWDTATEGKPSQQWNGARKAGFARRSLTKLSYMGHCCCCEEACDWKPSRRNSEAADYVFLYDAAQKSVRELFSRLYFDRLWPVQEIGMAQKCTFHAGKHSIKLGELYHALEMLSTLQSQLHQSLGLFRLICEGDIGIGGLGSGLPLLDLLAVTRHLNTTTLHDRIYALRSLAGPSAAKRLKPDYSLPLPQLWIDATAFILQQDRRSGTDTASALPCETSHPSAILAQAAVQRQCSDALNFADEEHASQEYRSLCLPSWVADMGSKETSHWQKYEHFKFYANHFSAGGQSSFRAWQLPRCQEELEINASLLCTVEQIHWHGQFDLETFSSLCYFARQSQNFTGLDAEDAIDKRKAARDLIVLLLQGRDSSSEDGLLPHLNHLEPFAKQFVDGPPPLSSKRRHDGRSALQPKQSIKMPPTDENKNIARLVFTHAFPKLHAARTDRSIDMTRSLATFSDGRIGWVPHWSRPEDSVYLIEGCPCPFVFRSRGGRTFENVGDVYVHGIMHGEAWTDEAIKVPILIT